MIKNASTLRQAVQDMTPLAALDYVLEAYEELTGQEEPHLQECAALRLTPQQATIFCMMRRRLGQLTLSHVMLSACDVLRPEAASENALRTHISMMRPKLAGHYTIGRGNCQGYTMDRAPIG